MTRQKEVQAMGGAASEDVGSVAGQISGGIIGAAIVCGGIYLAPVAAPIAIGSVLVGGSGGSISGKFLGGKIARYFGGKRAENKLDKTKGQASDDEILKSSVYNNILDNAIVDGLNGGMIGGVIAGAAAPEVAPVVVDAVDALAAECTKETLLALAGGALATKAISNSISNELIGNNSNLSCEAIEN